MKKNTISFFFNAKVKLHVIELDKVEELIYRSSFLSTQFSSSFNNKELNFINV